LGQKTVLRFSAFNQRITTLSSIELRLMTVLRRGQDRLISCYLRPIIRRQVANMRILAGALLLVGSAVIAGGGLYGEEMRDLYATVPLERGSVVSVVKATGVVNAVLMVEVGSQLSGQISDGRVHLYDV